MKNFFSLSLPLFFSSCHFTVRRLIEKAAKAKNKSNDEYDEEEKITCTICCFLTVEESIALSLKERKNRKRKIA